MKFIKISTHTEAFMKSIPENFGALLEAHSAYLKKEMEAGRLLEIYVLPGDWRAISIWEFESAGEVEKHFWDDPINFTFDSEIYVAADVFSHIQNVMPMFKSR